MTIAVSIGITIAVLWGIINIIIGIVGTSDIEDEFIWPWALSEVIMGAIALVFSLAGKFTITDLVWDIAVGIGLIVPLLPLLFSWAKKGFSRLSKVFKTRREKRTAKRAKAQSEKVFAKAQKASQTATANANVFYTLIKNEVKGLDSKAVAESVQSLLKKMERVDCVGENPSLILSTKALCYFREYVKVLSQFNEDVDNLDENTRNEKFATTIASMVKLSKDFEGMLDKEVVEFYRSKDVFLASTALSRALEIDPGYSGVELNG